VNAFLCGGWAQGVKGAALASHNGSFACFLVLQVNYGTHDDGLQQKNSEIHQECHF
jgi:hypothetical protein